MDEPPVDQPPAALGLALSGGGARAIAFHLGCLRGLDRHGLLDRVDTISAVSGGSVIAALWCRHSGSFAEFEAKVETLLRGGLVGPALRVACTSLEGIKAALTIALLLIDRGLALAVRWTLARVFLRMRRWSWLIASPFPRRYSVTTLLEAVFDRMLEGATVATPTPGRPELIIIACELQARSAFYFARAASGSWRLGRIVGAPPLLGTAVAASAAYPVALPALDRRFDFLPIDRKPQSKAAPDTPSKKKVEAPLEPESKRAILTDGGVYDNLGLAPFWPGRDQTISLNVRRHERLIVCRAGYGLRMTPPVTLMVSRMYGVFESLFARSQNLGLNRLYELHAAGAFRAILTPYLDQDDGLIANKPSDYIDQAAIAAYPTDFSAMSQDWIDRLSARGEQQVDALLAQYWAAELPLLLGDAGQAGIT